ncbi:helix-turn-helix transcriptional regulator [Vallitalea pronyensis]|uniref:Helix-turn-helix transcriptional regulator n=1 Tax=Vallitalea pronyensis TaxID=1348613 RepID=A0A8J8MNT6_9FIRM|nr:helix-turn-helix transcriptional regulator [Vallitalea pronyensis]QUI24846.1 helix-turn-helix transcriptional regulator [Vallitalea pronyensis]
MKELRKKLGLSQGELAQNIGITQSKISAIEKKKNYPSFETLVALKDFFGTSYSWLIEGKENNTMDISNELKELIKYFNKLPYKEQCKIIGQVEYMAKEHSKE